MQEYKTNYSQMKTIFDYLEDGWKMESVEPYMGFMTVNLIKGEGNDAEMMQFDMEAI